MTDADFEEWYRQDTESCSKNMTDNLPLSEQYHELATQWVDADAAATLLESCKSAFLSQSMQRYGNIAVNKAEQTVKASPEWRDYVEKMVNARKNANLLKVTMETLKMRFHEWNSEEATKRAEMRL